MKQDIKQLVIARLDQMPSHIKVSVGDVGSFSKSELIRNVEEETPIGQKLAEIQLAYIKSFIKK
jgi:hypothetical protein